MSFANQRATKPGKCIDRSFDSTLEIISGNVMSGFVNSPSRKQWLQYAELRLPSAFVPPPRGSRERGIPQLWQTGLLSLNISCRLGTAGRIWFSSRGKSRFQTGTIA